MNPALLYLHARSVRGRIVRTLLLLKQPKYLVGILVFVAWMVFWIGGSFWFDADNRDVDIEFANAELFFRLVGEALPAFQVAAALLLALLVSLWWLVPWVVIYRLASDWQGLLLRCTGGSRHLPRADIAKSRLRLRCIRFDCRVTGKPTITRSHCGFRCDPSREPSSASNQPLIPPPLQPVA